MLKTVPALAAFLLVHAFADHAGAQEPVPAPASAPAPASPAPSSPAPGQPRRVRVFTGLQVRYTGTGTADGVITPAHPVVTSVVPGSPAERAGVRAGDVIIEVNGTDSRAQRALWWEPGTRYTVRLRTGEEEREVSFVAIALPPAPGTPPAPAAPAPAAPGTPAS